MTSDRRRSSSDCSACARIRSIDPVNNTICVDAGCVLAAVQQAAIDSDRLYAVSLGAEGSCQIGGTIATNAGGTGVLRYGNTRDNVLGLEVVLPDGSIWNGLHALRKNNTGYDLKHLFIGSEGTLGIITGAVLKLHPLPTARSVAWLSVASPQMALDVLGLFRGACDARLSAFELLSDNQIAMVLEHVPGRRRPIADDAAGMCWSSSSDTGDASALDAAMQGVLERALERGLVTNAVVARERSAARRDVGIPPQRLGSQQEGRRRPDHRLRRARFSRSGLHRDARRDAVRAIVPDLPIVIVAHMGDGNVHLHSVLRLRAVEGDRRSECDRGTHPPRGQRCRRRARRHVQRRARNRAHADRRNVPLQAGGRNRADAGGQAGGRSERPVQSRAAVAVRSTVRKSPGFLTSISSTSNKGK